MSVDAVGYVPLSRIKRSFATPLFTSDVEVPRPEVVGPGTFVRLRNPGGETRERAVYDDEPIDALRGEISMEDAEREGLLGRPVGALASRRPGRGDDKQRSVVGILPAAVHAAQDIVFHYDERLPGEPSFAAAVHVRDGSELRDFVPIIGAVAARQERVQAAIEAHRRLVLTLGALAKLIGTSISELLSSEPRDLA